MSLISISARDRMHDVGLLLLRVTTGCFMLTHGLPKLAQLVGDETIQFADPFGFGQATSLAFTVFAEVVCAFLIIIGLLTRLAAVPLALVMAVAFFYIHQEDAFGDKELAGLYLMLSVLLIITGSGRFSIDYLISKRRNKSNPYYTTTNL